MRDFIPFQALILCPNQYMGSTFEGWKLTKSLTYSRVSLNQEIELGT
jgi:hypothetical protein